MTVEYVKGNAFEGTGDAVVVTINCIGAMGAGIALECKHRLPWLYETYKRYCRRGAYLPGRVSSSFGVFKNVRLKSHGKCSHEYVVLLPTKFDWRKPSKIEWVDTGLADLARLANEYQWKRVDMTLPGTANGWIKDVDAVKGLVGKHLGDLQTSFVIHTL